MSINLQTKVCDMLGIEYPVLAFNHCRDVIAAVSNGGGCGILGCTQLSVEQIAVEIKWLKEHTNKPFGIDLLFPANVPDSATMEQLLSMIPQKNKDFVNKIKQDLGLEDNPYDEGTQLGVAPTREIAQNQLDVAINAKPAVIALGLGAPKEAVEQCHKAGIKVICLVGNVKNARRAAELGADIIVAQGTEAGGHTGRVGTLALVPQVVDAVSPIPVLAAGGIGDGRGLVAALALGAAGVWTGTIWLTCHEYPLADWIKDRILESSDEDAVVTKAYTGKTMRCLNNKYIEAWNQPTAPKPCPMPLQSQYAATVAAWVMTTEPKLVSIYDKPDLRDWTSTPAGNVVGLIKQRKSAKQTLYDMVMEAINILS